MNKYELLEITGEGAYGIVIKARSKETNEFVAIKKFKEKDDNEDVRRCIYRELKMLKTLRASENIVSLKEAYRKRGNIYFVFEYVDRNMLQLLEEHPRGISQDVCKNLIFQLCKAVEWCHSHDIIHRDIKPENLLISYDGRLKLCDFGFARKISSPNENGFYTEYVATRWYRPPELLLCTGYGKPVDIWAIGAILGELSDGQPLFPGDSDLDQLHVIQTILGPLSQSQLEYLNKNPKLMGYKFPKQTDYLTLRRKYNNIINEVFIDFMEGCLELDPTKRFTINECLQHRVFKNLLENRSQPSRKASRCKKANSFSETNNNNNNNTNRIYFNQNQNQNNENVKLKLSLNDLTAINKNAPTPKPHSNNNNNNRITTSSMSVSTFSPRTTQNNSTNQFTEFVDERYNRSDYLNNFNNHAIVDLNSNSEMNQLHKSLSINGLSYNNINLNSTSSFLLKSKDNFNEDIAAFNKYVSKYNVNATFGNDNNSKTPRDRKGYLYYGSTNNIDENSEQHLSSGTGLLTSRQKVQFKDEYHSNSSNRLNYELSRTSHLSQSQNHLNSLGNQNNNNNNNPKFYRADSKLDNTTKFPAFKEAIIKSTKRSKTSMEPTEQDDSSPLTTREITREETNPNINNTNKIIRSITQLNTINVNKPNNNNNNNNLNKYNSKTPTLQLSQTKQSKQYTDTNSQLDRLNKIQQQYNNNNNELKQYSQNTEKNFYKIIKSHLTKASQSYRHSNNNNNNNVNKNDNNSRFSYNLVEIKKQKSIFNNK